MANKTTKTAGTNKSFIDRMGGQKFIVFLIVIAMFIFFCAMSPGFRKYTTFVSILDYSYYIALMAIGVAFPLMTGGVDLSIGTGPVSYTHLNVQEAEKLAEQSMYATSPNMRVYQPLGDIWIRFMDQEAERKLARDESGLPYLKESAAEVEAYQRILNFCLLYTSRCV